jgi:hypothetical protein
MAPNYQTYKQAQEQQQGAQQPTQTANPLAAAAAQEATRQGINAALGGGAGAPAAPSFLGAFTSGGGTAAASTGLPQTAAANAAYNAAAGVPGAATTEGLIGAGMGEQSAAGLGNWLSGGAATSSYVLPIISLLAANQGLNAYNKGDRKQTAMSGAVAGGTMGMTVGGPVGAAIGTVLGALTGLTGKTGKGMPQRQRDVIRAALKEKGVLDENWQFNRPNGGFFDLGKEKHMGPNQDQYTYNVWSPQDPMTVRTIPLAAIAAANLAPGDRGQFENWNSMITNMATSGVQSYDQVRDNIRAFLRQMGATPESTAASLKQMLDKGVINQQEFDVYQAHNASLLSTAKPYYTNEQAAAPLEAPAATGTTPAGAATPATSPAASTPAATTTQGTTQVPRTETTPSRADAVNGVVNALSSLTSPAQRIQQNVQSRATTPTFMSNFLNKIRG